MRSRRVPLAVVVLAVCAGHASAAAADFDIWKCPLPNAAPSKMGQDVSSEYHCISTAEDFIKGSIAGMGYFEGVKSNFAAGSDYVVSWFNMSLALGNPDRTQLHTGSAAITYALDASTDSMTATWEQWTGGDAPAGDRISTQGLGPRLCVQIMPTDVAAAGDTMENVYNRVCLSAGGPAGANDLQELPQGLDRTFWTGGGSDMDELTICHMGRSTVVHFAASLTMEECSALETITENHTVGGISCADNGARYDGYMQMSSTVRFAGKGSLGLIGSWYATHGPLKGYQGTVTTLVSKHADAIKAVSSSCILDAVDGGILSCVSRTHSLATDDQGVWQPHACDAAKTRGFVPLERFCHPDEADDYVNPWAPRPSSGTPSTAPTPLSHANTKVLKCDQKGFAAPDNAEYHCLLMGAPRVDAGGQSLAPLVEFVSGSYGNRGFFEGAFSTLHPTQARINRFEVGTRTRSLAGIVAYNSDFSNIVGDASWGTGSSSAAMDVETDASTSVENCMVLAGADRLHALSSFCMIPQRKAVEDVSWAGVCTDMKGFKDSQGHGCSAYVDQPSNCEGSPEDGVYDPPSLYANREGFDAGQACCVCMQTNLPFVGSSWIRNGVAPEPITEPMGELAFCSQGINPVVPHSLREFSATCTKRMIDEGRCDLTPFDNRSVASDSLIFGGSSRGVLGIGGTYSGSYGQGHMLLVLAGAGILRGVTCAKEASIQRCKWVEFRLHLSRQACQPTVMDMCKLTNPDTTSMTWPDLRPMRALQRFYTGGLGDLARKSKDSRYGVWACVKDWDELQQLYCASGPGRLVCFQYEDISKEFEFWGHNSDLRLVETSPATSPATFF